MTENMKETCTLDAEFNNRERRKLIRKSYNEVKKNGAVQEESNCTNIFDRDICDCLNDDCPGCHFPCPKCKSFKCAFECRINRKWTYDSVENESDLSITIPNFIKETQAKHT